MSKDKKQPIRISAYFRQIISGPDWGKINVFSFQSDAIASVRKEKHLEWCKLAVKGCMK